MKKISLAVKRDNVPEPPSSPTLAAPEYHPSVYMSFPDDRLEDLPASGVISFRYKVRSRSEGESEYDGKKSKNCSVELELLEITDASGAPAAKIPDAEAALETLKALIEKDDD
jgi:hypothetical protein